MELTELKDLMGIDQSVTKHDGFLQSNIPILEEKIKRYTHNRFENDNGEEILPSDVKGALAEWMEYKLNTKKGIASESMGEVSVSYTDEIPPLIKDSLKPYRKLAF